MINAAGHKENLWDSATTHAVRAAIQRSKASIQELSDRYSVNPKTIRKWKKRDYVDDAPMGPKEVRSTVLSNPT
jgi:transposase-like protein